MGKRPTKSADVPPIKKMEPASSALLAVEYLPPGEIVPYGKNARSHSDAQVGQIAASIREFGFTNPLLVDENNGLIAGHGRLKAAFSLSMPQVPVLRLVGLTAAQRRALVLADNRIALSAGWDLDLLRSELGDLRGEGMDLGLLGFDPGELVDLFAVKAGHTDPDDAPPAPEVATSQLGDVWLLGPHRVVCGDACEAAVVQTALGEHRPHLLVADPPYGVGYDAAWRNSALRADGSVVGARATGKVDNDGRADWRVVWQHSGCSVAYVWHGGLHASTVEASLLAAGFKVRSQIIWVKSRPVISRGDYHWQHEPLFAASLADADEPFVVNHEEASYGVLDGEIGQFGGGRKQSTTWFIDHLKSDTGHSTQKPVECMRRPIVNNSKPGEAVFDPFLGSGTTVIAGEMTGRRVIGIELNPVYVDVIVKRWEAFTGHKAVLERAAPKRRAK